MVPSTLRSGRAPWGGTHASAPDLGRFLGDYLAARGTVVRPETARLMTRNHNPAGFTPRKCDDEADQRADRETDQDLRVLRPDVLRRTWKVELSRSHGRDDTPEQPAAACLHQDLPTNHSKGVGSMTVMRFELHDRRDGTIPE